MSTTRSHQRDLFLVAALTVAIRLPAILFPHPIDDEGVYALVGNAIVDGGRPYLDAIERKPPLLFWTYSTIIRIAGEYNWPALHVASTLWVFATMAGLYVLARRLFDADAGLAAALMYSVFQPWGFWKNLAFNGEVLMNLPIVWGWAVALGPPRTRMRVELAAAGALLGCAFLLKQPAAIAAVPLGLVLFHPTYRTSYGYSLIDAVRQGALLSVGFAAPIAVAALVLARQGALADAVYWTLTNHAETFVFWARAGENTLAFIAACLPVLVAAGLSLRDREQWESRRVERWALVAWLVVSAIGAAAGGRFYPHYYIQLQPPLAILGSAELARVWNARASAHSVWNRRGVRAWIGVCAGVYFVVNVTGLWLLSVPDPTAQYVRAHSAPDDRIFVWGQSPGIYLEARRAPASRYITTFPLTGYIFGPRLDIDTHDRIVPGAWDHLDRDLDTRPPLFIVDAEVTADARYPLAQFPRLAQRVASGYTLVAQTSNARIYRRLH